MHVCTSWFLAAGNAHAPVAKQYSKDYFKALAEWADWLPAPLRETLATGGVFADWPVMAVTYSAPLVLQTVCALLALAIIMRLPQNEDIHHDLIKRIRLWAILFAAASIFAFNVLVPDIWLTAPWGRMILAGQDPYLAAFPAAFADGTPLDIPPIRMTYGPVWAGVIAFAMWLAGDAPTLAWLFVKVILFLSWSVVIVVVGKIAAGVDARRQACALILVGWLPVGFHNVVAEGHNDGLMVALLMLWLYSMTTASWRGPVFFLASVLTKYIVAPLVVVDMIYHVRARSMSLVRYMLRAAPAVLIALPVGLFLISDGRLSETTGMREWRFLEPYDLLLAVENFTGIPLPKTLLPQIIMLGVTVWALWRLWRRPDSEHVWLACLCMMSALLFTAVGHVWPWFYVWVLPFAALAPSHLISRFVIGACLIAPFSILRVMTSPYLGNGDSIFESVLVYGAAFGLLGATLLMRYRRQKAET